MSKVTLLLTSDDFSVCTGGETRSEETSETLAPWAVVRTSIAWPPNSEGGGTKYMYPWVVSRILVVMNLGSCRLLSERKHYSTWLSMAGSGVSQRPRQKATLRVSFWRSRSRPAVCHCFLKSNQDWILKVTLPPLPIRPVSLGLLFCFSLMGRGLGLPGTSSSDLFTSALPCSKPIQQY